MYAIKYNSFVGYLLLT